MTNKLKILMIVGGFPSPMHPYKCIFNLRAAKQLSQYVDIEVVSLRMWLPGRKRLEFSEYEGIKKYTLTAPQVPGFPALNISLYNTFAWKTIRPLVEGCDLVHSVYADGPGILSSLWTHRSNKPHILQIIGDDVDRGIEYYNSLKNYKSWNKYVHGVVGVSNDIVNRYLKLYPDTINIKTIYRGTDLDSLNPNGAVEGPLSNHSPVRFSYFGGFPPPNYLKREQHLKKGGKSLLKAWAAVEEELYRAGATLLLAGPNSDLKDSIPEVAKLKYPENVKLIGSLTPQRIPNYMRASDVVVLPSHREGLPNVAQEAMACGKALIGSSAGGLPELIDYSGETGYLVPPKDVTALSEALIDAAQNPDKIKQMGIAARQKAERLLDNRDFAPKVIEMYESVIKKPLEYN